MVKLMQICKLLQKIRKQKPLKTSSHRKNRKKNRQNEAKQKLERKRLSRS